MKQKMYSSDFSNYKALIIGGSAGSFQIVLNILNVIPKGIDMPIFLCLHRLKHVRTGFVEALMLKSKIPIIEPCDKDVIKPGKAYLAPANYHMYIEIGNKIALSTEEPVHHSRPSIDLSFYTAAQAYRSKLIGIILSGANKDGALGFKKIADMGGYTIVQDPKDCEVAMMTESTLNITNVNQVLSAEKIINFISKLK